jgi:hypothetical protein
MHDGKIVREHRVAFGGRVDISPGWPNERAFWDGLRVGKTVQVVVNFEVGDDSYRKMTDDGVVIGLRRVRSLKAYSIHFPPAETELDGLPMFEAGDNIADPLTQTAPDEECFCAHVYGSHQFSGELLEADGSEGALQPVRYPCAIESCNCSDFDPLNTPMRREPEDMDPEATDLARALAEARA